MIQTCSISRVLPVTIYAQYLCLILVTGANFSQTSVICIDGQEHETRINPHNMLTGTIYFPKCGVYEVTVRTEGIMTVSHQITVIDLPNSAIPGRRR